MVTEMQKRVAKDILENLGRERPKTKKDILKDAGYSKAMQKNPDMVFESKGFRELIEEALPDVELARVHREGLSATSLYGKDSVEHPDFATRYRYLEGAYKIKGKLEQGNTQKTLIINVMGETAKRYGISP